LIFVVIKYRYINLAFIMTMIIYVNCWDINDKFLE
jgi:hypothetical protein